jgi:O-succinylbenzoic acid--CoA ligase
MDSKHKSALPDPIFFAAHRFPFSPSVITPEKTISYSQLNCIVAECKDRLEAAGWQRGERAGILMPNSFAYTVLLFALLRAGLIAVPLSTRWPEQQIREALKDIDCRKLIVADTKSTQKKFESIPVFSVSEFLRYDLYQQAKNSPLEGSQGGVTDSISPNQDATIIFTSGSAGKPKAVLHACKNHYFNALGANQNLPFGPGNRWLLSLPFYHVGGLGILFRAALGGGAVVIPESGFDLAEAIARFEITHVSLVVTQLYRLLKNKKNVATLKKLQAVLLGGSAAPASLIRQACEDNIPLFTTYGCTEMASQATTTQVNDTQQKLLTSGKPLTFREVMISPESEILVKGKTLCKGYLTKKGLRKPFTRDGWFATGDLGAFDADGYLIVKGRKDNMFISGGENILPEEIEQALGKVDGVLQAVVVPVADAEFGHRPVAFVKMQSGRRIDADFLAKNLARQIARFKIPERILPWPDDLQKNHLKIDRKHFERIALERFASEREMNEQVDSILCRPCHPG